MSLVKSEASAMSYSDFQAKVYEKLHKRGVIHSLQSQLRKRMLEDLTKPGEVSAPKQTFAGKKAVFVQKLTNSLISQHMQQYGYAGSKSVFDPEVVVGLDEEDTVGVQEGGVCCSVEDLAADLNDAQVLQILGFADSESKEKPGTMPVHLAPLKKRMSSRKDGSLLHAVLGWLFDAAKGIGEAAVEQGVQTESSAGDSLARKLTSIDCQYDIKQQELRSLPLKGLEARMRAWEQEVQSKAAEMTERRVKHVRTVELDQLRTQLRRQYTQEKNALREQLQREYQHALTEARKDLMSEKRLLESRCSALAQQLDQEQKRVEDKLRGLHARERAFDQEISVRQSSVQAQGDSLRSKEVELERRIHKLAQERTDLEAKLLLARQEGAQEVQTQLNRTKQLLSEVSMQLQQKQRSLNNMADQLKQTQESKNSYESQIKELTADRDQWRTKAQQLQGEWVQIERAALLLSDNERKLNQREAQLAPEEARLTRMRTDLETMRDELAQEREEVAAQIDDAVAASNAELIKLTKTRERHFQNVIQQWSHAYEALRGELEARSAEYNNAVVVHQANRRVLSDTSDESVLRTDRTAVGRSRLNGQDSRSVVRYLQYNSPTTSSPGEATSSPSDVQPEKPVDRSAARNNSVLHESAASTAAPPRSPGFETEQKLLDELVNKYHNLQSEDDRVRDKVQQYFVKRHQSQMQRVAQEKSLASVTQDLRQDTSQVVEEVSHRAPNVSAPNPALYMPRSRLPAALAEPEPQAHPQPTTQPIPQPDAQPQPRVQDGVSSSRLVQAQGETPTAIPELNVSVVPTHQDDSQLPSVTRFRPDPNASRETVQALIHMLSPDESARLQEQSPETQPPVNPQPSPQKPIRNRPILMLSDSTESTIPNQSQSIQAATAHSQPGQLPVETTGAPPAQTTNGQNARDKQWWDVSQSSHSTLVPNNPLLQTGASTQTGVAQAPRKSDATGSTAPTAEPSNNVKVYLNDFDDDDYSWV